MATIHLANYQQKIAQRYDKRVRSKEFPTGDLVLCRVVGGARDISTDKLAQNWKGLYIVTAIVGIGAYYLEDMEERPLPRPWNVQNLKKYCHEYVKL